MKLPPEFYQRGNVTTIAKELIGKQLVTKLSGCVTAGIIVETEAYSWKERGSHAFGAKKTVRNQTMFNAGGCSYVYLCYGIHHLFNVVTNRDGVADAVLIRAVEPVIGIESMRERRNNVPDRQLTSGPGKLAEALGITRHQNAILLMGNEVWVEEGFSVPRSQLVAAKRIGIDYAGEDANLPWRFYLRDNLWVSKR